MREYVFDDEVIQVDRDLERAIIRRFLEKRYISTAVCSAFVIGFLCGIIAYAL